jgi:hypothetical protein
VSVGVRLSATRLRRRGGDPARLDEEAAPLLPHGTGLENELRQLMLPILKMQMAYTNIDGTIYVIHKVGIVNRKRCSSHSPAGGQDQHRRRSHETGFDRHMIKPADVDALRSMLNSN